MPELPSRPAGANLLYLEKSPYLLQHAFNPVDWHPWGDLAFEKARREDKPILLSIGYSTCHWCHVMEHESFASPNCAKVMNQWVVPIKLDREERPDVDALYMNAVTALTGQGGWPLNVFLTPDLKPFYGGTYFPPTAGFGRPAWMQVVEAIGRAWKNPEQRAKIIHDSGQMTDALMALGLASAPEKGLQREWLDLALASFEKAFDPQHGGFGAAPKFPMPVNLGFLLRQSLRKGASGESARNMALQTLRHMSWGGIHDHLGGGFARYSTDDAWHVPHFEKMLYDNAQLAVHFLEASQLSDDPYLGGVARGILDYVIRDLGAPEGGFYSAEDADSLDAEGVQVEGAFYAWTQAEIFQVLGPAAPAFCAAYGVRETGNVEHDPHGEFHQKNVLRRDPAFQGDEAALAASRRLLFERRAARPRPHRDEKILTAWNGLMVSALAKGWQVLGESTYLKAGQACAAFLMSRLFDAGEGRLYRRFAGGERAVEGMASDYADLIQGLLDLYESDGDFRWLEDARRLSAIVRRDFFDMGTGACFNARLGSDPMLLTRLQESQDNVEPSAASVMAQNWLRLELLTGEAAYREDALGALKALGGLMATAPRAAAAALSALDMALSPSLHVVVVSEPDGVMLKELRRVFAPRRALIAIEPGEKNVPGFARGFGALQGKATAYICVDQACRLPSVDIGEALSLLKEAL